MRRDGRVKTSYDYYDILYEPYMHVRDRKTDKSFYIVYKNHYLLGKAIQKIKRSKALVYLGSNYKMY